MYDVRKIQYKFGLAARYARKEARLSQDELARAVKINRSCISQYETGSAFPTLITAIQLCNALGLTLDGLIELCDRENYFVDNVYRRKK